MPLEILLALVILGIAGIALLLHLTGRSARTRLSAPSARAHWLRHFPDDTVLDVTVADSGDAALVRTPAGPGLLWAFGADTVARPLQGFDLLDTRDGVRVIFHDFAAPSVRLTLTPDERASWRQDMTQETTPP